MSITPQTLKGFRDFPPEEALKRQYAIDIIRKTFETYGFEPIETPALEYLEVFTGNIGEDEHLFYKFQDAGGRNVALRYDQTVPTCRFIAQYRNTITLPFKRYQIQTVWRAEKPQKGRYREFLQCDADIFGVNDRLADSETIALSIDIFKNLGFSDPIAIINDRAMYSDIPYKAIVAIDKLTKIGPEGVVAELVRKGFTENDAEKLLKRVQQFEPNENLKTIFTHLTEYGMKKNFRFQPTLARSFSYSSGTIWEIVVEGFDGSLLGGERYDDLIGRFANTSMPAVGFAVGFDRTMVAMDELNLFPLIKTKTQVLITIFDEGKISASEQLATRLRSQHISVDLYSNPTDSLEKQLKYANKKGIPFVVIIGPDEVKNHTVTVKNMTTKEQKTGKQEDLVKWLKG